GERMHGRQFGAPPCRPGPGDHAPHRGPARRRHRGGQHARRGHRLQLRSSAGRAGSRDHDKEGVAMSIRIKLILPGVLILVAALALALWPDAGPAGLPARLLAAAAVAVIAQWLANERWVLGGLRAIHAALAGQPAPPMHSGEW